MLLVGFVGGQGIPSSVPSGKDVGGKVGVGVGVAVGPVVSTDAEVATGVTAVLVGEVLVVLGLGVMWGMGGVQGAAVEGEVVNATLVGSGGGGGEAVEAVVTLSPSALVVCVWLSLGQGFDCCDALGFTVFFLGSKSFWSRVQSSPKNLRAA